MTFALRLLAASACAVAALAVQTKTWSQGSMADYEKASLKNLSLRNDGRLSLAPESRELFDAGTPFLWAMVRDSKGDVFVAGGAQGGGRVRVHRVDAAGKTSTAAEVDGLEIHALAVDKQDRIYAATSPDGKVWRLGGGSPQVFYDPKAKYIWGLAFTPTGELIVATGDQGEIHAVTAAGQGRVLHRLEDAHARSLAIDGKGHVIVGSEPSGLVVRVSPAGDAFVLHQCAKREVTSLAIGSNGSIYAAAAGNKSQPSALPALPPPPSAPATPPAGAPVAAARQTAAVPPPPTLGPAAAGVSGGSEIVEIQADGAPRKLWTSAQEVVYSLAVDARGALWAGTGNKGALYRIESPVRHTLVTTVTSSQVTGLASDGPSLWMVTANVGKLFRLGPGLAAEGSVESEVFDAGAFSFWGRLNAAVTAPASVRFETRSGNLDRPRNSWSPWAALSDGRIASPAARFLQWRAILTRAGSASASPELSGVDIAWLTKNTPPRVEEIEASPLNYRFPAPTVLIVPSNSLTLPPLGRKTRPSPGLSLDSGSSSVTLSYAKGSAGVRWLATDENGDELIYTVEIRGVGESGWKLLKERVKERYLTFDSTAFPDGEYIVRVTASDSPDNPPRQALTDRLESDSFVIDNTAPEIRDLAAQPAGGRVAMRFRAVDALGWIAKAEYSVNGIEWLVAEPVSKLSDSRELAYDLLFDRPSPGELTVAVRVTDEFDNQSVQKVVIR